MRTETVFVLVSALLVVWESGTYMQPKCPNTANAWERASVAAFKDVHTKDIVHHWFPSIEGGSMILCVKPFEMMVGCEV